MKLAGKIALIAGSSQGIGRAIAERFAPEGADVVINYNRTPGGAEEALRNVEAIGRRGLIVKADLSDATQVRNLVATGIEHFGRLDTLVSNVGIETYAFFWEVTEEDSDRILNVQPQRCLLRHPGNHPSFPGVEANWQDHQYQFCS